jgi:hypothetical protein
MKTNTRHDPRRFQRWPAERDDVLLLPPDVSRVDGQTPGAYPILHAFVQGPLPAGVYTRGREMNPENVQGGCHRCRQGADIERS